VAAVAASVAAARGPPRLIQCRFPGCGDMFERQARVHFLCSHMQRLLQTNLRVCLILKPRHGIQIVLPNPSCFSPCPPRVPPTRLSLRCTSASTVA
jgi:hypothetical protein